MKLIFLDFDGVLNYDNYQSDNPNFPFTHLDPIAVNKLNRIYEATGAVVVFTTTWRESWKYYDLCNLMRQLGYIGTFVAVTPIHRGLYNMRGNEILDFIQKRESELGKWHEYSNYVILDDDEDVLFYQKDNFVHVDRTKGLSNNDVGKAINILNNSQKLHFQKHSRMYNELKIK